MRVVAHTIILFSLVVAVSMATAQQPTEPAEQDRQVTEAQPAQDQQESEPAAADEKTDEQSVGSTKQKASYILGYVAVAPLMRQRIEIDVEKFIEGVRAAQAGKPLGMEQDEVMSVQNAFRRNEEQRIKKLFETQTQANKVEGEKLMEEFAKQEGAQTIEDGVQYVVIETGEGDSPADTDEVKIHYEGAYVDGEVFDSSRKRGKPFQLGISKFVPGFTAALKKMKVGDKWKVAIRGDRAYAGRPQAGMEPFKSLIFELELLEIIKK